MQGLVEQNGAEKTMDPEEEQYLQSIEREKNAYKDNFNKLRELKSEIEHIQMMLEKSRVQLQKDFEQWYGVMLTQQGLTVQTPSQTSGSSLRGSGEFGVASSSSSSSSGVGGAAAGAGGGGRPPSGGGRTSRAGTLPPVGSSGSMDAPLSARSSTSTATTATVATSSSQSSSQSQGSSRTVREAWGARPPPAPAGPSASGANGASGVASTGDAQADADIAAFYKARESLRRSSVSS